MDSSDSEVFKNALDVFLHIWNLFNLNFENCDLVNHVNYLYSDIWPVVTFIGLCIHFQSKLQKLPLSERTIEHQNSVPRRGCSKLSHSLTHTVGAVSAGMLDIGISSGRMVAWKPDQTKNFWIVLWHLFDSEFRNKSCSRVEKLPSTWYYL